MQDKINEIEKSIDEAVKDVQSSKTLQEIKLKFLGKTGVISSLMKNMRDVPPEQRPSMGKVLNALRQWSEEKFAAIEKRLKEFELKRKYDEEQIDVTLPGRCPADGALHPNTLIRNELISIFAGMGFEVYEGPEIENDYRAQYSRRSSRKRYAGYVLSCQRSIIAHANFGRTNQSNGEQKISHQNTVTRKSLQKRRRCYAFAYVLTNGRPCRR